MSEVLSKPTPQQTFEEKLSERIRKDIGELMPDEALAKIIEAAIDKAFFAERKVKHGYGYGSERTEPSWLVVEIKKLMQERMDQAVKAWVSENQDKILELVGKDTSEAMGAAFIKGFHGVFSSQIFQFQQSIQDKIGQIIQS